MTRDELMRTVEGPQRRMPRHIFSALSVLLLLLGCACGPAHAGDGEPPYDVMPFVPNSIPMPLIENSVYATRIAKSFASPFIAAGNGVMVALAEAGFNETTNDDFGRLVAGRIDTEGENWTDRTTENNGNNWKTTGIFHPHYFGQFAMRSPTAVVKGDKIYLLALNNRGIGGSVVHGLWHVDLFVGAILGQVGSKNIDWDRPTSLIYKLTEKVNRTRWNVFPGSDNSALLTSKGNIVFSVNATDEDDKRGFAIMQLNDGEEQWKVSFVKDPGACRVFSLFEWKERLVSVFSGCPHGTRYVKEYDEVEEKWKDADDAHYYFLSDKATSRDVTPVTIGNKTVLLFTRERLVSALSGDEYEMFLFFTDGNRVFGTKRINTQSATPASGKLLYTNGELFFIYQNTIKPSGKIVFQRLNWQLEEIRSALNAWDETDAYLSKPCNETVPKDASPVTLCVTPMPTAGLVAFLSNRSFGHDWKDEYRFRDAWVERGLRVKNGYKFSKARAGARWEFSVDEWAMGKGYNLDKYGLTVVTTMIIHEIPKDDTSLLSFGALMTSNSWGLWYKGGQLKVVSNNGEEVSAIDLETQKEYRVALTLQNKTISAYVDGKSQGSPLPISASGLKPFDVDEIYIGGYEYGHGINLTVTNVLIYKRVLSDSELEAASKRIVTETPTDPKETPGTPTAPKEIPGTPTDPKEDNSEHVRVGASLLFLFGLRALALVFSAPI